MLHFIEAPKTRLEAKCKQEEEHLEGLGVSFTGMHSSTRQTAVDSTLDEEAEAPRQRQQHPPQPAFTTTMKPKAAPRIARWRRAPYQQHADCEEAEQRRREGRLAFWAQSYRPLDERQVEEEVEGKNKKERYKHLRKNVGKALRSTWKCLMLGLYNLALCYSTPANVVATFVPDFSPARNRT